MQRCMPVQQCWLAESGVGGLSGPCLQILHHSWQSSKQAQRMDTSLTASHSPLYLAAVQRSAHNVMSSKWRVEGVSEGWRKEVRYLYMYMRITSASLQLLYRYVLARCKPTYMLLQFAHSTNCSGDFLPPLALLYPAGSDSWTGGRLWGGRNQTCINTLTQVQWTWYEGKSELTCFSSRATLDSPENFSRKMAFS